jgi:hypothetical protein
MVSRIVTPDARCVRGAIQRYTSSGRVFEVSRRTQPMGLPDEELGLLEHRVRAARERLERSTVLQRRQFCEQRRPSDPEVVVASPPIQRPSDAKVQSHLPDHVAGEHVHQRPRPRLADQPLDQREVLRSQIVGVELQDERRGRAAFEGRDAPELLDQAEGSVAIQPGIRGRLPGDPPDVGEGRSEEVHVALEVSLLARRAFRRAGAFELRLDRPRELLGIDAAAHASFL